MLQTGRCAHDCPQRRFWHATASCFKNGNCISTGVGSRAHRTFLHTEPLLQRRQMAEELNLLSLPNDLLASIALKTALLDPVNLLKDWAKAASTCKRLWELQLPLYPPAIRKRESKAFRTSPCTSFTTQGTHERCQSSFRRGALRQARATSHNILSIVGMCYPMVWMH